jgi:hypothetical protein
LTRNANRGALAPGRTESSGFADDPPVIGAHGATVVARLLACKMVKLMISSPLYRTMMSSSEKSESVPVEAGQNSRKDVPIDVVRRIQGLGSLTHQREQLDVFKRFDQGHR